MDCAVAARDSTNGAAKVPKEIHMFLRREHVAALVVAVSLAANAQPSHAQWNVNGVQLGTSSQYTNPGNQAIITDGDHGAIVTWTVPNTLDIYAQHVLASGIVDSAWTNANGN